MKTVSLELSKQLKEAGYPQEEGFKYCGGHTDYFEDQENGKFEDCPNTDLLDPTDEYCHTAGLTTEFTIASPTADEILDQLPTRPKDNSHMELIVWKGSKRTGWNIEYRMMYHDCGSKDNLGYQNDESLADACAKMWLYLKKEGL